MSRELLTGLFGKLPSTGDFVVRGLPPPFHAFWDRFCTLHLAPMQRAGAPWPEGGLRFRLASGGRAAMAVVVPSRDSVGRAYPLAVFGFCDALPAAGASLDLWLDEAARAAETVRDADLLWQALEVIAPPSGPDAPDMPGIIVWRRGEIALEIDAGAPDAILAQIFAAPPPAKGVKQSGDTPLRAGDGSSA